MELLLYYSYVNEISGIISEEKEQEKEVCVEG